MQNDKYAPNSYFFIDPAVYTQSAGQAFGPITEDEFRLTTKFTLTANSLAHAICKCVVKTCTYNFS